MANNRKDQAVSEVMGTILMVALVVILAAVIGALVFGMVGNLQETKVVGVTATRNIEGFVTVSYNGADKADQLYWMNVSINGNIGKELGTFEGTTPVDVGNTSNSAAVTPGSDHVIVVAHFSDGTEQVVLDTMV